MVQQPQLRIAFKLFEHFAHRAQHRKPAVNFCPLIDAHANQKNHKVSLQAGIHSFAINHGQCSCKGLPKKSKHGDSLSP